jgi:hypothetical protein
LAIVLRTYPKIFPEKFKTFGYPDFEMQRPELGLLFLTLISCEMMQFYNVMIMDTKRGLLWIKIIWQ